MNGDWLHDFLHRESNFALIEQAEDSGWLDGGCQILADALLEWLGAGAQAYYLCEGSSGSPEGMIDWPAHALVRYGDWYLDGDGVSSEEALLRRWTEEELLFECWLEVGSDELRNRGYQTGIPSNLDLSHLLAQRLRAEFGVGALMLSNQETAIDLG